MIAREQLVRASGGRETAYKTAGLAVAAELSFIHVLEIPPFLSLSPGSVR